MHKQACAALSMPDAIPHGAKLTYVTGFHPKLYWYQKMAQGQKSYAHHYKVLFFQVFISPSLGQRTARASYLFLSEDDGSALSFCSTTFGGSFHEV